MIAYAWASGHIEFGRSVPDGALHIAKAPARKLKPVIEACARHGYGASVGVLLVPGIPEAPSQAKKLSALIAFQQFVLKSLGRDK